MQFLLGDNLIYYQDNLNDRERLCIPKKLEQKVFELAHDNHSHGGFQRTYERIVEAYYMRHLIWRLKRYILHYPQCQHHRRSPALEIDAPLPPFLHRLTPYITPPFGPEAPRTTLTRKQAVDDGLEAPHLRGSMMTM